MKYLGTSLEVSALLEITASEQQRASQIGMSHVSLLGRWHRLTEEQQSAAQKQNHW